ncbi:MAG: hypothetical protein ACNA7Z_01240 [Dethiobacteria bacterium]
MQITLHLKGPLKKYGDNIEPLMVELEHAQVKLREIIEQLEIPASSISFIQINGEKSDPDTVLTGGEVVVVNPRVAGG